MPWQLYKNSGKPLPTTPYNLRSLFHEIEDQGVLGACTAFATLQCFAVMRAKEGYPWQIFSQLAEWYKSRELYGKEINDPAYVLKNQGVMEDDALNVLIQDGVVNQTDDPWNTDIMIHNWVKAYQTDPPDNEWITSIKLRSSEVYQIDLSNRDQALLDVRDALANSYPVLWSTLVFDNWFHVPTTGIISDIQPGTQNAAGGHEINIIGDDPVNKRLLILNQWGPGWGIQFSQGLDGCAWISYDYFKNYTMALFVLIPDGNTPTPPQPIKPTPTPPAPKPQPTPVPPKPSPTPPKPAPGYLSGGDVSKFQGNISWPDVAKSWSFAFVKALDGRTPIDPNFTSNYVNAKVAGLIRGPYQVGYPIYESAQDAYNAYKAVVLANGGFELPPIIDVEKDGCGPCTPVQVTQWSVQWLTLAIKDYGRAIIYSNEDYFNTHIDVTKLPKGTILWVANYSNEPKLKWTFWQHTDKGSIPGISTNVDLNYFKGTLDDLKALIVKEGGGMTQSKVQVNGKEFPSVVVNGDNYIHYNALKSLPGCSMKYVNGEWQITVPVTDQKPVKVTLTYADGSTQTL